MNENPICPKCHQKLKKNGKYGKNHIQRYLCTNDECEIKTVSDATITRQLNKYTKLFALITKLIDEPILETEIRKEFKIPESTVNKIVKSVIEHNEKAIDNCMPALYLPREIHMLLIEAYESKMPIVTFFPNDSDGEIRCCISKHNKTIGYKKSSFLKFLPMIIQTFSFEDIIKIFQQGHNYQEIEENMIKRYNIDSKEAEKIAKRIGFAKRKESHSKK